MSSWRRISMGSWRPTGDSSVYTEIQVCIEGILKLLEQDKTLCLNSVIAAAISQAIVSCPEVNSVIRFGKIYRRKNVDIFFHVLGDGSGEDLSGIVLRNVNHKTLHTLSLDFRSAVERVRVQGDPDFRIFKKLYSRVPGSYSRILLNCIGFFLYSLNLPARWFGASNDSFGSLMVTNMGSLGIEFAFCPIAPYTRIPMVISLGRIQKTPFVIDDTIKIVQVMRIGIVSDHRILDGFHIAKFNHGLKNELEKWNKEEMWHGNDQYASSDSVSLSI